MSNTFAISRAPKSVQSLYHRHREEMIDGGKSAEAAHGYALRMLRLSGNYLTSNGWKQLTPDLRDKVNVREAIKQPDGRYVIDDVDAFYPNAVKGGESGPEIYSAADIRDIIRNTNQSIEAGGWRPTLIEGHQHPAADMLGSQFDGHGYGVNWRESPRGSGWARCTLVDVEPEYLERIRDRKLPGLSARISNDAGKTNRRFGHIAMLGGTPPALSRLPMLEVFSVSNQVCFSAESDEFSMKGSPMKMNPEHAKKMADCFSALGASYASYAAGETGAEDKLHEAHTNHLKSIMSHVKGGDFGAYLGDLEGGEAGVRNPHASVIPDEERMEEQPDYSAKERGSEETELADTPLTLDGGNVKDAQRGDFSSASNGRKLNDLLKKVDKLAAINSTLQSKLARTDFHAECDTLRKDGYQLPAQDVVDSQWENCFSASNPKKSLGDLAKFLRSLPKGEQSPADFGVQLGLGGAVPLNGKGNVTAPADLAAELSAATGRDFSSQDVTFGAIFANAMR